MADNQKIRRILQVGPIGSRGAILVVWIMEDGSLRYSTGCQIQINEKRFISRVTEAHGESAHWRAYMEAIEFAHKIAAAYAPVVSAY